MQFLKKCGKSSEYICYTGSGTVICRLILLRAVFLYVLEELPEPKEMEDFLSMGRELNRKDVATFFEFQVKPVNVDSEKKTGSTLNGEMRY